MALAAASQDGPAVLRRTPALPVSAPAQPEHLHNTVHLRCSCPEFVPGGLLVGHLYLPAPAVEGMYSRVITCALTSAQQTLLDLYDLSGLVYIFSPAGHLEGSTMRQ